MTHALLAELGDVDEPRRLDADVHKDAKIGDVPHRAAHESARFDIGKLDDGLPCQRRGQVLARISSRLYESREDVADGGQARIELFCKLLLIHELGFGRKKIKGFAVSKVARLEAEARKNLFCEPVGLGMNRSVVERRRAAADAQEARALGKGCGAEARHLQKLLPFLEGAVLVPIGDDVLRNAGIDARDMAQQLARRRIEVNAHMVHGGLNGGVEGMRKLRLIDVVLVLPDADGLRVNLDEFGERVLHAACNGNRTSNRYVILRQFLFRQLRGGINGGARLVRDQVMDVFEVMILDEFRSEFLRFEGGGAVADGNQRHMMLLYESQHFLLRRLLRSVALRHLNDAVVEDVACGVHHGQLAARAVAGVESQHHVTGQRRLQKELLEIRAEDVDCLRFGLLCQRCANLALQGGKEQPFVSILHGETQRLGKARRLFVNAPVDGLAVRLMIRLETHFEAALLLAAVDSQHAMGGKRPHRLLVGVVHQEGLAILRLLVELGDDDASLPKFPPHFLTQLRFFHDCFGHDISGARQRLLRRRHALFPVDEIRRHRERVPRCFLLREHRLRQRREASLPGNLRAGAFLLFIRKIEVFELL